MDNSLLLLCSLFPVHTTTMKRYNHLISTDNKGYASYLFEQAYNNNTLNPGEVRRKYRTVVFNTQNFQAFER